MHIPPLPPEITPYAALFLGHHDLQPQLPHPHSPLQQDESQQPAAATADPTNPDWGDDPTKPNWGDDPTKPNWGDDDPTKPNWGDDEPAQPKYVDPTNPDWGDDGPTPVEEAAPDDTATAAVDEVAADEVAADEGAVDKGAVDEGGTPEATDDGTASAEPAQEEGEQVTVGDGPAAAVAASHWWTEGPRLRACSINRMATSGWPAVGPRDAWHGTAAETPDAGHSQFFFWGVEEGVRS